MSPLRTKLLFIILFLGFFYQCRVYEPASRAIEYGLVNSFSKHRKVDALVKKTLVPNLGEDYYQKLFNSEALNTIHYNVSKNKKQVDFASIFSEKDYSGIIDGFKNLKVQKLDGRLLEVGVVNKIKNNVRAISVPVISPNGKYSFIYSEGESDNDIFCMKNTNGEWVPFALFPISTSD